MLGRRGFADACGPRASSISMRSASTTERWRTVVRPIAPKRISRCRIRPSRAAARAPLPLISRAPTLIVPGKTDSGACGRGDAFLAPGKAEPLAGGRLDRNPRDSHAGNLRYPRAHGVAQRPDFRTFADQRDL